ncbi:MAG: hypothetical protein ACYTEN_11675 [Planctomycetota bacterium]
MLSGKKLTDLCKKQGVSDSQLAEHLARGGMSQDACIRRPPAKRMLNALPLHWVSKLALFQNGVSVTGMHRCLPGKHGWCPS